MAWGEKGNSRPRENIEDTAEQALGIIITGVLKGGRFIVRVTIGIS